METPKIVEDTRIRRILPIGMTKDNLKINEDAITVVTARLTGNNRLV